MTSASLVDALSASKRVFQYHDGKGYVERTYNSMILLPDEWASFADKYDDAFIGNLTTFYDVTIPYSQWRRGKDLKVVIPSPQINMLCGSTPTNLLKYMPEHAWDQGFTSRIILVYSNEREIKDDFDTARRERELPSKMVSDFQQIGALNGEFKTDQEFQDLVNHWRVSGENPRPTHPKLVHYNSRRRAHVYKLAMVSSADRGNSMRIDATDFHRAIGWLESAELNMNLIFDEGQTSTDARAMDEIVDYCRRKGELSASGIMAYAMRKVPAYQVAKVIDILVHAGRLSYDNERKSFRYTD